jgi:hypothetical protein
MCELPTHIDDTDPSASVINREYMEALINYRPRPKNPKFHQLVEELKDPNLAEVIWYFYGSVSVLDSPIRALNMERKWWQFWKPKNTIRSLMQTREGKQWVWRMLHGASVWLL